MIKYKYTEYQDIYNKLIEVVSKDLTHEHYAHTLKVAEFWERMFTGQGHMDYIATYRPSESTAQKSQKFRVYKPRTKYMLGRNNVLIKKSDRVDLAVDQISYEGSDSQEKADALRERLNCFHSNKPAKVWLDKQFNYLNCVDPNSFGAVNFYPFNADIEKPYTYPIVIRSKNALMYENLNGNLQYLVYGSNVTVEVKDGKTATVRRFHMLAPNFTICVEEIAKDQIFLDDQRDIINITKEGKNEPSKYFLEVYKTDSKNVPACGIGYVDDPCTDGQTKESMFFPVKEILEDHMNKKAELDVIILTHGIAQKFAHVPACNHVDHDGHRCAGGKIEKFKQNGGGKELVKCGVCKGTGKKPFHTSSQDIITLEMAYQDNTNPEHFMDLSKMIHYANIPENVIKLYQEQVQQLEIDSSIAMFGHDFFTKDLNEAKTPEAIRSRNDSLNNVLFEYCKKKSEKYEFIVKQTADFMQQLEGLQASFRPSTDFKLESLDDLLEQLKSSEGAPKEVKDAILAKIYHKQNQDNPDTVNIIKAREKWRPFVHMTEAEKMNAIESIPEYHPKRILSIFFNSIFSDIENAEKLDIGNGRMTSVKFHQIASHEIQRSVVDVFTKKYTDELKALNEDVENVDSFRDVVIADA